MNGDFESLQREALRLSPDQRAKLISSLVHSLASLSGDQLEALWLDEAERRDREMEEGRVRGVPGNEILARLRARYG